MNKLSNSSKIAQEFMANLQLGLLNLERENNRERVIARMNMWLSQGRRMYGSPPAWFEMKNQVMCPFIPNALVVRDTYERIASGELATKPADLIAYMQRRGFTNRKLEPTAPTRHHIATLLSKRGIMEAAGFVCHQDKWIRAVHLPIISSDVAGQVLVRLGEIKVVSMKDAIIYCRVATQRQVGEGNGLDNQKDICQKYCEAQGYDAVALFQERGVSANEPVRPALKNLLSFIKENPKPYVVVACDRSRFSRDIASYQKFVQELQALGCTLELANEHPSQ